MTIHLSSLGQVYLVCGKTDMRQGIDSLAYLVKTHFELDPFSGQVFLFCGGRKDRFKALYWDGQGFWLLYKRFENGRLTWPSTEKDVKALTPEQVDWLMKGFSITPYSKRVITRYLSFMELLLYTISKVKLLEDILMPQPIVPVEIPQSRRFDSKKRNDILLKIRIGKLEVSFFQSLNIEMIEQLLDKVLLYDNSSI
ncbi:IS66-Spn1 transposase [Streptococcus pneumoniae]|nr:IS66-Spn1 transposase [Streptococcus pneumoniae]